MSRLSPVILLLGVGLSACKQRRDPEVELELTKLAEKVEALEAMAQLESEQASKKLEVLKDILANYDPLPPGVLLDQAAHLVGVIRRQEAEITHLKLKLEHSDDQ